MEKYIDAEKLIAEIDNIYSEALCEYKSTKSRYSEGVLDVTHRISFIIGSLKQKQLAQKKSCAGCPHCVDRKDQYGWHFNGCFGGPYKGKFIAEIDECPLQREQPEMDLEKFTQKMEDWKARYNHPDNIPIKATMAFTARMFYQYPNVARQWYDNLPKATMD